MNRLLKAFLVASGLLIGGALVAYAANTVFFTAIGDLTFPFKAPLADGSAGSIDNMAIGATTPRPGAFTTLSSTSAPSGAGITALFASPPPIGSSAPAAIKATTLGASGQISSTAGAPSIASGNCGATTNGTVAGTNQSGTITIGAASTTTCQIDFSATLGVAPKACLAYPGSAGAAAVTVLPFIAPGTITTAHFILSGAVLASTVWNYFCF